MNQGFLWNGKKAPIKRNQEDTLVLHRKNLFVQAGCHSCHKPFYNKKRGGLIDIMQLLSNKKTFGWDKAPLSLARRLEYVDWNVGKFSSTGDNISENLWSIMPAICFRPS